MKVLFSVILAGLVGTTSMALAQQMPQPNAYGVFCTDQAHLEQYLKLTEGGTDGVEARATINNETGEKRSTCVLQSIHLEKAVTVGGFQNSHGVYIIGEITVSGRLDPETKVWDIREQTLYGAILHPFTGGGAPERKT